MRAWLLRLRLRLNPPKVGDTYLDDAMYNVIGRPVEKVLHGMKAINGDMLYEPMVGEGSYKLTIDSDSMPYYICSAQVLVKDSFGFKWLKRSQPRRILKKNFIDMIIDGRITKEDKF